MIPLLKIKILGQSWRVRLLSKRKYRKKHGKDSIAITRMHKRIVDLSPQGIDFETVVHELVHCYSYELCVRSTNMEPDDVEEFFAELIAKRGQELIDLAHKVTDIVSKWKVQK